MEPGATRFSVIIPAYNEQALLPRLLDTIDAARERYQQGPEAIEIIVADNSSSDRTAELARARGCRVTAVEKRVIGAARNGGARVARGEILAFIDADTQIHPETFNEIDRVLADPNVIGGASGMRFERSSPGLTMTFGMLVVVGSLIRLAWGERPTSNVDTGVVFCHRRDFEELGGYTEERFFAEDVQLLLDLHKLGKRRGQHLARGTNAKAIFSTRKFDQHGDWHYFPFGFHLILAVLRDRSALTGRARRYWYER
jgi:glycosyltransferase involved in cell wall biosynthesis